MEGGIYFYTYPPQTLVAVSGGSTYHWKQDSSAYFHNPQIREDDYSIGLSDHSFMRYGQELNGYWTRYHEDFQPSSAFPGQESVPPASIKGPTHVNVVDMDTTHAIHNSWPDHMLMSVFSDRSHLYAPVDKAPNVSVSSTLTGTLSLSTIVGYEGVSSARSDEEPDKPFKCSECSKRFARKQSVGRHYRKRHHPNQCLFSSCDFKWGGPYDYRYHLKGQHKLKNDVIDTILGKTAGSHCRATIIGRDPPKQFPPPLLPLYMSD